MGLDWTRKLAVSAEWIRTLGPSVGAFLYICWRRCYWVFSMSANLVYLIFPTTHTQNTSGQYVFLSWKYHPEAELSGYFIIWHFSGSWIHFSSLYVSQVLGGFWIYAELLLYPLSIFRKYFVSQYCHILAISKLCIFTFKGIPHQKN